MTETFPITVGGLTLRARWAAPRADDRPPLVFLHEGLGSIVLWRDFPERLAAATGLGAFVFERAGHGASDPPAGPRGVDYLDHEAETVLPAVLDAAGIGACVPFGHSDGGSIALLFAAACPDRVAAAVTEAAHVFVEDVTLAGIRVARGLYGQGLADRLRRYHGTNTDGLFDAWSLTWLSAPFRDWRIDGRLGAITSPFLVIQGRDDEYGSPAQVAAIAAGTSGITETLLIPGCAHTPHLQAGATVLRTTRDFIVRHVA